MKLLPRKICFDQCVWLVFGTWNYECTRITKNEPERAVSQSHKAVVEPVFVFVSCRVVCWVRAYVDLLNIPAVASSFYDVTSDGVSKGNYRRKGKSRHRFSFELRTTDIRTSFNVPACSYLTPCNVRWISLLNYLRLVYCAIFIVVEISRNLTPFCP